MRSLILLATFLSYLVSLSKGENIVGIFVYPSKSHFTMAERLLKRLAEKGHYIDVVTHFPSEEAPPRYNQLSVKGTLPTLANNLSINHFKDYSTSEIIYYMMRTAGTDACQKILDTPVLQNIRQSQKKYDLIITHIFGSDCMVGFTEIFNASLVSLVTSINLPWANDRIGSSDNPSYIPNYFSWSSSNMNFNERIENTILLFKCKFLYYFLGSKKSNEVAREFFGTSLPSLESLTKRTSLLLVNSHFSMNDVRPAVINFLEIGGLHIRDPKPLSEYFEALVTTEKKGIIYLSMGSMIMTETFDVEKLQAMFDAFAELPYKVLWKADEEKLPKTLSVPDNIHFEKWMPQLDILCHPNIKLFISHGGLLGAQESIYCNVPRLGIPFFADQEKNIRNAEKMGVAVKLVYDEINKNTILTVTKKILEDPTYKQNTKRISRVFKDRPMSPLDTAVYWIEYVLRHKAAPHIRSPAADLPWYQYYLIDVGLIFIFGFFFFCYVIILLYTVFRRLIYCGRYVRNVYF